MTSRHLALVLIATTLVGCEPAPPPGVASSQFDGTYVGSIQLTGNSNAPNCFTAPAAQIVVVDGKLEYRHLGWFAIVRTVVHDDGSFHGLALNTYTSMVQRLEGKVSGNLIEAVAESPYCRNHLTLKKVSLGPHVSTVSCWASKQRRRSRRQTPRSTDDTGAAVRYRVPETHYSATSRMVQEGAGDEPAVLARAVAAGAPGARRRLCGPWRCGLATRLAGPNTFSRRRRWMGKTLGLLGQRPVAPAVSPCVEARQRQTRAQTSPWQENGSCKEGRRSWDGWWER
jgi:hypothetical protein